MLKTCPGCDSEYIPNRSYQKFCTMKCGKRVQTRERLGIQGPSSVERQCRWCRGNFKSPDGRRDYCGTVCARIGGLLAEVQRKYGITKDQYRDLYFQQDGKCAVCGDPERTARNTLLAVDHDHISGQVRGLLCSHCNRAIGLLRDDPEVIRAAAVYVARNRQLRLVNL